MTQRLLVTDVDLREIEQRLGGGARVALVDARLLKRVMQRHRRVSGVVPHLRCYALAAGELGEAATLEQLGLPLLPGEQPVILVARPPLRELERLTRTQLFERVLRAAYHARVHLLLEQKLESDAGAEWTVRQRVERLGRAAFEELRAVFSHDDVLLPPASDREVYVEFAATFLELGEFAPELLPTTFPGLLDHERIRALLAEDLELSELGSGAPLPRFASITADTEALHDAPALGWLSKLRLQQLRRRAERAARHQHHAQSALLAARSGDAELLRSATENLARRLEQALGGDPDRDTVAVRRWVVTLKALAERAVREPSWRSPPEARILAALDAAAVAHESPGVIVDVPSYVLSLGKRPIVRPRLQNRAIYVARACSEAAALAPQTRGPSAERAELFALMQNAVQRADDNARTVLGPRILAVLEGSGLGATTEPEREARDKLVLELGDQVLRRGFLSLPQLRDAISANDCKLTDLQSPSELWRGDPLLRADRGLQVALDGLYRRGDVYLRFLQKVSSIPFGTRSGRWVTLYFVLPLLGSFIVLEGVRLIVGQLLIALGHAGIAPFGVGPYAAVSIAIFGLLHSEHVRVVGRQLLAALGVTLAWLFFRAPLAILTQPVVVRALNQPIVRAVIRRLIIPAVGALLVLAGTSAHELDLRVAAAVASFAVLCLMMGSRVGSFLEDWVVEQLAPTWHVLSRRWLPALFRLIARLFGAMLEALDRVIHRIGERIAFQRTGSVVLWTVAGAAGVFWAVTAYVVRLYVTLLVEPEINPIKHFPVVTVMHKLTLPFVPEAIAALERPLSILGPIVGGALAAVTVFLLPSAFGFLAWELKSNYGLYRATRSRYIGVARFGPHGETLRELLLPGFHSGTVPKLFERLRRAAQRYAERRTTLSFSEASHSPARARRLLAAETRDIGQVRAALHEVENAVRRFAQRELLPPLQASSHPALRTLFVARIELSSHRIRVRLASHDAEGAAGEKCELVFAQLGGRIVASLAQRGFVRNLDEASRTAFENALAVFYHRADVDLVREQIEGQLGPETEYELGEQGLTVFADRAHHIELLYRLDAHRKKKLRPRVTGGTEELSVLRERVLRSEHILYPQQRIARADWERARLASDAELPRLLSGPRLV